MLEDCQRQKLQLLCVRVLAGLACLVIHKETLATVNDNQVSDTPPPNIFRLELTGLQILIQPHLILTVLGTFNLYQRVQLLFDERVLGWDRCTVPYIFFSSGMYRSAIQQVFLRRLNNILFYPQPVVLLRALLEQVDAAIRPCVLHIFLWHANA